MADSEEAEVGVLAMAEEETIAAEVIVAGTTTAEPVAITTIEETVDVVVKAREIPSRRFRLLDSLGLEKLWDSRRDCFMCFRAGFIKNSRAGE